MKHIALGVAVVCAFWCGVAYEFERRPPRIVYFQKQEPVPAKIISSCQRALQLCKQEWKNKKG